MERVQRILQASIFYRVLAAASRWIGGQWAQSRAVRAFLNPSDLNRSVSQSSVFARLWQWLHGLVCRLYEMLRLERLLGDSVWNQLWFWGMAPMVLAPLLPTMAVVALEAAAICALALRFARQRQRQLVFTPINKYVMLYCAVYVVGTAASVTPRASLPVGLLTVFFTLFALVPVNVTTSRRALVRTVQLMVLVAAVVSLYGVVQYVFRTGYQSAAWVDEAMFTGISFRVVSTFENPNMLGQYLVLMIPLGGACLLNAKSKKERWIWLKDGAAINQAAVLEAMQEAPEGVVVVARRQNEGMDSEDFCWRNLPGTLTFAVILRVDWPADRLAEFTLLVQEACTAAVLDFDGPELECRKPNDLYLDGRKVGSIHIQSMFHNDIMRWAVIGVGLNVNTPADAFPEALAESASSLYGQTGRGFSIPGILRSLLEELERRIG